MAFVERLLARLRSFLLATLTSVAAFAFLRVVLGAVGGTASLSPSQVDTRRITGWRALSAWLSAAVVLWFCSRGAVRAARGRQEAHDRPYARALWGRLAYATTYTPLWALAAAALLTSPTGTLAGLLTCVALATVGAALAARAGAAGKGPLGFITRSPSVEERAHLLALVVSALAWILAVLYVEALARLLEAARPGLQPGTPPSAWAVAAVVVGLRTVVFVAVGPARLAERLRVSLGLEDSLLATEPAPAVVEGFVWRALSWTGAVALNAALSSSAARIATSRADPAVEESAYAAVLTVLVVVLFTLAEGAAQRLGEPEAEAWRVSIAAEEEAATFVAACVWNAAIVTALPGYSHGLWGALLAVGLTLFAAAAEVALATFEPEDDETLYAALG